MNIRVFEEPRKLAFDPGSTNVFSSIEKSLYAEDSDALPIRFIVSGPSKKPGMYDCEVGYLSGINSSEYPTPDSIFEFRKRKYKNQKQFNAVFMLPTGIDAEIGGHCGDAAPAALAIAAVCDNLVVHPNVVNAADINEMSANMLYVEGSILTRLMMGTVGITPSKANRIMSVFHKHDEDEIWQNVINSVGAARASGGFHCSPVCTVPHGVGGMQMHTRYADSNRATGDVTGLELICNLIQQNQSEVDTVAISTVVDVDEDCHDAYFQPPNSGCDQVEIPANPYGGVEALLTHALTSVFNIQTAHSPMYESVEQMNSEAGIVDPRKAADCVSVSYLHCIIKGLSKAPGIVTDTDLFGREGVMSVEDISCLIVPGGCLSLPVIAALHQGIAVIEVCDPNNTNLMKNSLDSLPWREGKYIQASSYLEAAGIAVALREGLDIASCRRPLLETDISIDEENYEEKNLELVAS